MIRLNLASEPFWLECRYGVRLKLAPLTSSLMIAARKDERVLALGPDASGPDRSLAVAKAVARLAILEWDGVGDDEGNPAPVTPENIDALMDLYTIYEDFEYDYLGKGLVLDSEKNGSSPSPNGITAGASDIAKPAGRNAPNAPTS